MSTERLFIEELVILLKQIDEFELEPRKRIEEFLDMPKQELGGVTPREAIKTHEGREDVISLIKGVHY